MRRFLIAGIVAASLSAAPQAQAQESLPMDPVAPVDVQLVASVRLTPTIVRACPDVRRACVVEQLRGVSFELRATPAATVAGLPLVVEVLHRVPGARKFGIVRRTSTLANAPVGRRFSVSALDARPGITCLRARLPATAGTQAASSRLTCIRHRPPVEIGWAGDIVVGSSYGLPPNGGRDQLRQVAPLLQQPDLMIGNYEGTLSRGGASRCSGGALCFIFQAPPARARNLRAAGFDVMNLANNHGLDKGADARRQTVRSLQSVGIAAAGLPGQVTRMQVADTVVAVVGMSPYAGTTSMRSPAAIRALVAAARRDSDVVVMAFHAGLEGARGAHVPRGSDAGTNTRAAVHAAVDAGADVVFGSGPHVVRGVERYRGRYIIYSSGNFAGWHNFALNRWTSQSGVVRMTFNHRGDADGGVWDGVIIDRPGVPRPDRSGAVVRRVAALSRADFGRSAARFGRAGRFR